MQTHFWEGARYRAHGVGRQEKWLRRRVQGKRKAVLMRNHVHLLLRNRRVPLAIVMQRLLTSYAMYFNLRYRRHGQMFQNMVYWKLVPKIQTGLKQDMIDGIMPLRKRPTRML